MTDIVTKEMDGSTLLGFLAAIGSLRLFSKKDGSARLRFDLRSRMAAFSLPGIRTPELAVASLSAGVAVDRRALDLGSKRYPVQEALRARSGGLSRHRGSSDP